MTSQESLPARVRRYSVPGVTTVLREMAAAGYTRRADVEAVLALAFPLDLSRPVAPGPLHPFAVGLRCLVGVFDSPHVPLELVERIVGEMMREAIPA